jgi:hypothetical protein
MKVVHKKVDRVIVYYNNEPEDRFKFSKKMYRLLDDEGYKIVYSNPLMRGLKVNSKRNKVIFERVN